MRGQPKTVSPQLEDKLRMYARVAASAGVGMLALTQSSAAKIIYTPADVKIDPNSQVTLDLNHDGITDFTFANGFYVGSFGTSLWILSVAPANANQAWGHKNYSERVASALFPNVRVSNNRHFSAGARYMAGFVPGTGNSCSGPWANVHKRYLGLKFEIKGKTHFGWARLKVSCLYGSESIHGTLTGYAYEAIPGKSIVTGKEHGSDELAASSQTNRSVPSDISSVMPGLGGLARGRIGSTNGRPTSSHAAKTVSVGGNRDDAQ